MILAAGAAALASAAVPLCTPAQGEGPAPRAFARAVEWWHLEGVWFVYVDGAPGFECVPVYVDPDLRELGLRGLTVWGGGPAPLPVVVVAGRHDALALAHELGHVVRGPAHDPRRHHILSATSPRWRP